jgi:hypothetical protein
LQLFRASLFSSAKSLLLAEVNDASFQRELNWYAMGTKPFDLIETISDLLRRIDEGRNTIRGAQDISDNFRSACANREEASQRINKLQLRMVPPDEPSQSRARTELDRQVSELKKVADESNELWLQINEATKFLGPFSDDVLILLGRLPLKPEWEVYLQAVGSLNVRNRNSWTDPSDPALDTIEMRLREMLDLAIGKQRSQVRPLDPFPTPDGTLWKDVTITFLSDHRIRIAVKDVTETRSYAEMGFEDKRGGSFASKLAGVGIETVS